MEEMDCLYYLYGPSTVPPANYKRIDVLHPASAVKVKVSRSKNVYIGFPMELHLEIINGFIDGDANEATEEHDCTYTTRGVFKA